MRGWFEDSFSCFMKTKLAALMLLSGVVVHSLLLLTLQDEPRGSSGPVGGMSSSRTIGGTNFSFEVDVWDVPCAMHSTGATGSISPPD